MSAIEWSDGAAGPLLRLIESATAAELAFVDSALCAQVDTDLFFPEQGGDVHAPKRVCMACPVRRECLEYALRHDIRHGVWGGASETQRREMKRGRREAA